MARSHPLWLRNWFRRVFKRGPQLKKRLRAHPALEYLEDRIALSTTTYDINSSSPTAIPLGTVKPGQTVTIQVNFSTTDNVDPNDRTENEPLVIQGPGFSQTIYSYGTQSFKVPVSQKNEQLTAYIQDTDGDESGSIAVGDHIVQVKMDLAALAAPWLSLADDLQQSEQAIETILQYTPGWQFYPPKIGKPDITGEISGQVSVAPDGTIDGGQVGISGGVKDDATTELYWGLPAKLFGLSVSLTGGLGFSVNATASWDSSGNVTFGGNLKGEGSLTLAGNAYATFFKGSVSGQAGLEAPVTLSPDGEATVGLEATGQVAGTIQYKGLTQEKYVTLLSVSIPFGPKELGEKEINLSELVNEAVKIAEGDPLVVTSQPPSNLTDGAPFSLTVTAENPDGSVNTSFNGNVTLALKNYDGVSGTLGGTVTATAVNGVATFSGLTVTGPDDPYYYLSVSANGFPTTTSNYFGLTQPASQLVIPSVPTNVLANGPFNLAVEAEDSTGAVDRTYNGTVTLSLGSNPAGGTLGGTLTATAYNGVAYFYGLTINTPGTGYTLQASSSGLASATTPAFNVTDQLVITTQPPAHLHDGSAFDLVATVEDGQGNVVTSYNGNVTVALGNYYGVSGTLGGTATATAVNGVATFSGLTVTGPDDPYYYLSVSANGFPTTTSNYFGLTQPASQLVIPSVPTNIVANAPFSLEVEAEDSTGIVDPTFNGTVTLSLGSNPAGGTLGGTLTATAYNGVAYFYGLTIDTPGSGYTLQASSNGLTSATSAAFNVAGGQLAITTQPPQVVRVGSGFGLVVTAEDASGNVDTSFNGTVTVGLAYGYGTLGGTLTATAVNGVATFSGLTVSQGGYYELSITAPGLLSATTNSFYATTAAPATQLVVSAPFSYQDVDGDIFTGAPFGITVQAEDPNGNVDPAYNGTVTLSLGNNPAGGTLGGTITANFYYGVASIFGVTIDKAATNYTIQANAPGLTAGASTPFNVYSDQLVITTPPPSPITAGSSFGLVVSAENYQTGTVDTSFNGTVTLSLGNLNGGPDNLLNGTLTTTAVNGVATFSGLSLNQVGVNGYYNIEVSSNEAPDTFTTIDVVPGAATQLAVTSQPTGVTAGAGFTLVVSAEDASGNVDPTFNGTVALALGNNPGGGTLSGTLTAMAVNGVATFTGLAINNPGIGYTLQATSANLTAGTTNSINVTAPGVATRLVLTTPPPYSVTAGTNFGLAVTAEDDFGTVDTSFTGTVTVTDASGDLLGQVSAVNGVATFTGLTLDTVSYPYGSAYGAYPVMLNVRSNLPTVQTAVTVEPGTAAALVVKSPYNASFGSTITPSSPFSVEVDVDDANGNIDSGFYGNVTIALGNNSAGGTLSGTLTAYAYAGVATFTGLSINDAGTYSLQASASGLSPGSSANFDVVTDQLVVATQPPSSITAGTGFGVVVDVANAQGATDTSYNGNVTVSLLDFDQTGAALGGTLTVQAVNGVATFSGLTLSLPGSYALSVTGSGLAGTTTNLFAVTPVPTQLAVTSQPPSVITAGAGFAVSVAVEDANGNVVTDFNGGVTLALSGNPAGGTLGGTLTATAVNGMATFTGLTINTPGNGYTLEATANGLTSALTNSIGVTPVGQATQLVVTSQPPSSATTGTGFGLTVQAEDSLGNVDTSFNGTVVVEDAFGDLLGQTTAVNGVATFTSVTVKQVGSISLTVTGDGLSVTTNPVNATPSPATQLGIAALSTNVLTGAPFSLTVFALDPSGNVDSNYNGSVTLSLSSSPGGTLGGTLTATAVNGVATFSGLTISSPGEGYVIQAASPGLSAISTTPFDVTNDQLVVTTQPPANVTAGSGFGLVVSAETSSGSVDTSFEGNVTLSLTDPSGNLSSLGGTFTVSAVNGVATFTGLKIDQANSYTITASSDNSIAPATTAITVVPAAAKQLVVTAEPPADLTAGAGFTVTVAAEDANGNVDSTFGGSVTIALANNAPAGTLGGTLTVAAVNGVATFTDLFVNNPGSGYVLQATATNVASATTSAFHVTSPGVASQLVVTSQPPSSVNAGAGFNLVVRAEDGFDTVDSSFDGVVTINNPNGGSPLAQTTAVNGVATFTGLTLDQAGHYRLTVTASGLTQATTDSFTVNALAASELTVVGPLQDVVPNSPFEVDVEATDQYGNIDPTFDGSVTLGLSGATLSGATQVTAVHGLAEFTGLAINQTGTGYTLNATSSGLAAGTSAPFDVTEDQLVVSSQPPSTLPTNSSFGFTVAAKNASGNVDTSFNGVVTVALLDQGANNAALGGTLTATATNGVATFSGLSLNLPGPYQLEVTSNGVGGAVTGLLTVVGAAPAKASTTTSLSVSASTPLAGVDDVTLTATESVVAPGSGTPTGTVDFYDTTTGTDLGSASVINGVASLTAGPFIVGSHVITATYGGDSNFLSSSGTASLTALAPASLSGTVFADFNQNGQVDFGENGISGVSIELTGTNDLGHAVDHTFVTDSDGSFLFLDLRPGSYYLTKTSQPAGYTPGIDSVGTAGGSLSTTVADQFFIQLAEGVNGLNYNYAEIPAATGPVQKGQTAGIGFWNNKNGQALIKALPVVTNPDGSVTSVANWLAATFPHMFGKDAGANDLTGKSNAYVAALFQQDFLKQGVKLDAQVLATALSVYVTNATLDSTQVAAKYGFTVSGYGLGTATFNVGSNGAAFDVANNTTMTVMDLLLAVDAAVVDDALYGGNTALRNEANNVFSALNNAGSIS